MKQGFRADGQKTEVMIMGVAKKIRDHTVGEFLDFFPCPIYSIEHVVPRLKKPDCRLTKADWAYQKWELHAKKIIVAYSEGGMLPTIENPTVNMQPETTGRFLNHQRGRLQG
jgi:hypothetical protein